MAMIPVRYELDVLKVSVKRDYDTRKYQTGVRCETCRERNGSRKSGTGKRKQAYGEGKK